MKKSIQKATVLISAMIIALSAGACMTLINNDTANSVCKKLEAKYGEEFEVVKIGDRLVTSSAKTYVHPVSNSDIVFTARIDKSGNVDDDYVNHILLNSINQNIVSTFSDYGIVALSNAVVTDADVRETDRNLDLNSFTAKNNLDGILVYVAIDYNNEDPDTFISALEDATKDYDFELVVYPFFMDHEEFELHRNDFKSYPSVGAHIENNSLLFPAAKTRYTHGAITSGLNEFKAAFE